MGNAEYMGAAMETGRWSFPTPNNPDSVPKGHHLGARSYKSSALKKGPSCWCFQGYEGTKAIHSLGYHRSRLERSCIGLAMLNTQHGCLRWLVIQSMLYTPDVVL